MRALRAAVAWLALASGCAAARPPAHGPDEASAARDDAVAQHALLRDAERAVAAAIEARRCEEEACPAAGQVCELSGSLCAIAARHAGDQELAARCADGRRRCAGARARVAEVCGCAAEPAGRL
ncbi:MAG: hypothetical protein KF729_17665 [Sandaracinaceae bacterium]|nr:hypothetical protein [Sandaracinaceae bacterium]